MFWIWDTAVVLPGLSSSTSLHCSQTCASFHTASRLCSALNSPWNPNSKIPVVSLHLHQPTGGWHTQQRATEHVSSASRFLSYSERQFSPSTTSSSANTIHPQLFFTCFEFRCKSMKTPCRFFWNHTLPSSDAASRCLFFFFLVCFVFTTVTSTGSSSSFRH